VELAKTLAKTHRSAINGFVQSLSASVMRQIETIVVLALHGQPHELTTIEDAVELIERYSGDGLSKPLQRFEIEVRYNNGNLITGKFGDKSSAIEFLRGFQPTPPAVTY
jgi:hypothetical protein